MVEVENAAKRGTVSSMSVGKNQLPSEEDVSKIIVALRSAPEEWFLEDRAVQLMREAAGALNAFRQSRAPQDPALSDVKRVMEESGGAWRACTGGYETVDGYPSGEYPLSPALGCHVGCGCHECGGLGAVWEYWSDEDVALLAAEASGGADETSQDVCT